MSIPSALVSKLWNYCSILRDDGLSYGDYVDQEGIVADEERRLSVVEELSALFRGEVKTPRTSVRKRESLSTRQRRNARWLDGFMWAGSGMHDEALASQDHRFDLNAPARYDHAR